jgi:uncharacterized protein with von Willebrand factor type A (vWA) domain
LAEPGAFTVETIALDLPELAGAFSQRLHQAGLPVSVEQASAFARALDLARPVARRRLYWIARAVFVSDRTQVRTFDRVFAAVFGSGARPPGDPLRAEPVEVEPAPADSRPVADAPALEEGTALLEGTSASIAPDADQPGEAEEMLVPLSPSDEELLQQKRFDALSPAELAALSELMDSLKLAAPLRITRRAERYRHGSRVDLRRTLRGSLRTGGDPVRIRRQRRRLERRRLVLLCDISGSMEPYARAYLQFLICAAGAGPRAEAFVFATRLTRVTRALASRDPQKAIQNAAAAAPDWSSGTRIGDALKAFNDRHGRRGMARGAVVVILSDGWERGDPALVAREMERLGRLAHRIVWVNPRAGGARFEPRAGGMAAALEHCDALVSGHNLAALNDVVEAIAGRDSESDRWAVSEEAEEEPWGSATPMAGSSVAMPSGYGPRRGHTTPGWGS